MNSSEDLINPSFTDSGQDSKIQNDTSKSSLESSFHIQDYNCSSIIIEQKTADQQADICCEEVLLDNKMTTLELSDKCGSDSGVDICVNNLTNCVLQRALSSNSGGYTSIDEIIGNNSCNSSMISYCSDNCDTKNVTIRGRNSMNDYCTSEGGSESSSVTGGPVTPIKKISASIKKKVAVIEPQRIYKKNDTPPSGAKSRSRASSATRPGTNNTPKSSNAPHLSTNDRARSRDKNLPKANATIQRTASLKRPQKPDSFPIGIKDPASPAINRLSGNRTPSNTRARTPATPDDGRWPSVGGRSTNVGTPKSARAGSAAPEQFTIKTKVGHILLDSKNAALDKYATLPRRRKEKSADDLKDKNARSSSITRDNRMTSSTIVLKKTTNTGTPTKSLPFYPRLRKPIPKTKIYHETSVQTVITSKDVEDAFAGVAKNIKIDAVEMSTKETQSDIRDKEIEQLQEKLKKITENFSTLQSTLSDKSQVISTMQQELIQEREEKLAAQRELQNNSERVLAMVESVSVPNDEDAGDGGGDSLLILESQIQKSEHYLEKQEEEIIKLRKMCRTLQNDMERSLGAQRNLIQQQEEHKNEASEIQDFLQTENSTLMDGLKDAEIEINSQKVKLIQKDNDLDRLQEECRHLVRISEQRRQENLGFQAKYGALETRSKELICQQGSAVSGASVALTGLGSRLDNLVEQLIASYNISEQELEDVVYHNEAYTQSGSSGEGSPDYEFIATKIDDGGSLSPQRGHSFITAVISAIKSAASSAAKHRTSKKETPAAASALTNGDESDTNEMLDSETEPCLMMENVLEDVPVPDSHSHNLVSTSTIILSQIEIPSEMAYSQNDSLYNLSQAIENRQQIELQSSIMANRTGLIRENSEQSTSDDLSAHESLGDMPSITDYCSAQTLVDQVIDVDNLVTKLLKVLRIIQMDNDNCIQKLITDKNKLQLNEEEISEKLRQWEIMNFKLKDELKDATQQLMVRGEDLISSKADLVKHRLEIDRLNEDICHLSTLCSSKLSNGKSIKKDDLYKILIKWKESGNSPDPEVISHIATACSEIPLLQEKLLQKERQLNDLTDNMSNTKLLMTASWHKAVTETKRQYDAIDRALETLNNIQFLVKDYPELSQLQQDLEETNFKSASSLPVSSNLFTNGSDLNANGSNGKCIQINGDSGESCY